MVKFEDKKPVIIRQVLEIEKTFLFEVKIKNKKALEQLQAKLTLRMGRKFTQQETLDYCVMLGSKNIEQLIEIASDMPILTPDKAKAIIKERDKLIDIPYNQNVNFGDIDDDIYNTE